LIFMSNEITNGGCLVRQGQQVRDEELGFPLQGPGRLREMGLGSFDTYRLAEARERARECRKGKNSIEERNAEAHADEARRPPGR
jgi:hypothetical protein